MWHAKSVLLAETIIVVVVVQGVLVTALARVFQAYNCSTKCTKVPSPPLNLAQGNVWLYSCGKVPIWTRHKSANEITFDDEEAATVFSFDAHLEGLRDSFFVTAK